MSCYAKGRCRFCSKRHTLPIFGSDESAHELLQGSNLQLVVLNTVCSSCIAKVEHFFKSDLQLSNEKMNSNKIHGTIIKDPTKLVDESNFNNNLETSKKIQVYDNFLTQTTINPNKIDVDSTMIDDVQVENVAKVNDNRDADSTEQTQDGMRANADNLQITDERNRDTGRTCKKQRQLTCEFCRKEFNHTGDLNKHRRTHTGEQPYTCNKCHQKFSHASNLARHQRMHSGERPFFCRSCGRTFTRKDKLSVHLMAGRCIKILRKAFTTDQ